MKKVTIIITLILVLITPLRNVFAESQENATLSDCNGVYLDVQKDNVFCKYIEFLYHQSVFNNNECILPSVKMTRGQVAHYLVSAFNIGIKLDEKEFADVNQSSPYFEEISTLKKLKVVDGYSDGKFYPDNYITRGAFAKMIVRTTRALKNVEIPISDGDITAIFLDLKHQSVFNEDIRDLYAIYLTNNNRINEPIIKGFSDGTFRPDQVITKQEVAKIITNTLKYVDKQRLLCDEYYCQDKFVLDRQIGSSARCSIVGSSTKGRNIMEYQVGNGEKNILFIGAIHGSEWNSSDLLYEWMNHLDVYNDQIPEDKRIYIIPVINPDGLSKKYRFNDNNVDLNRNFDDGNWKRESYLGADVYPNGGGIKPFSEQETRILAFETVKIKPYLIISMHSYAGYVVPNNTNFAEQVGNKYAELTKYQYTGDSVNNGFDYAIFGSYDSWAEKQGYPAIVIELETYNQSEFDRNVGAMWEMVKVTP